MDSDYGSMVVSIVLGLGLASFFRKICKDGRCVIIKGPPVEEVKKNIYKIDNECYKYSPVMTKC
jgi:hypothetical protein